eukprot:TRINITY_DN3103_c3_g2_i1.p1 TRINITY_DN3103_c3_g2~~TRINITY_DN3103_c3_g2_i1.p1  ORF type:complete len:329 (+),score=120.88 TRINITY_DN3103_c3_g2_i1:90-1076(+)
MLQQRFRKQREQREARLRQRRVNSFVKKRQRMHWGMYAASEDSDSCGLQFDCVYTTCTARMRQRLVEVEILFRYTVTDREAEYYFPISEVGSLQRIDVFFKQGTSPAVEFKKMEGRLYEQLEDGLTQPWEDPKEQLDLEAMDQEDDARSETSTLLSWWKGDPKAKVRQEAEKKRKDEEAKKIFYFFGTSPELKDLQVGKDCQVKVKYVVSTYTERQKYDDAVLYNFYMPLTVFNITPNRWDITVEMPEHIRRIRPKQTHQRVWADLNGKRATVRFHEGYKIPLEDEMFVLQVELGDPIEPRCADPMALFIFATFIGLMVWFSLTKDLH